MTSGKVSQGKDPLHLSTRPCSGLSKVAKEPINFALSRGADVSQDPMNYLHRWIWMVVNGKRLWIVIKS